MGTYFSVWTIYRDDACYLREWIEFHLLVGAEHFFLYDNGSEDDHREILEPYVEEGLVTLEEWPRRPGLVSAMNHCLRYHQESRWIAFLDIDEFLFSPLGKPVPEVLGEFDAPAIAVNRRTFGSSGHVEKPDGPVIENYTRRARLRQFGTKSVVDPTRVDRMWGAHRALTEGVVDDRNKPVDAEGNPASLSSAKLRINHYVTKSEEELRAKCELPSPETGEARKPVGLTHDEALRKAFLAARNRIADRDILMYLPALKKVLGPGAARESSGALAYWPS